MNGFTVGKRGTSQIVKFRQFAQKEIVDNGSHEIDWVGWTPGNINGFDPQSFANPYVSTGIGCCSRDIAICRAGADTNDAGRFGGKYPWQFQERIFR